VGQSILPGVSVVRFGRLKTMHALIHGSGGDDDATNNGDVAKQLVEA
jgi:hypothetical protein